MLRKWNFELQLEEQSDKAIYLQIADALIRDIQLGRLKPGDALPGSRSLSQRLKINRNTVVEALQVLIMEGWLISKERQGTFVAHTLPDFNKRTARNQLATPAQDTSNSSSFRWQMDDGIPDSKIAPISALARAYRQVFNQKGRWQLMGYSNELGDLDFRKEVVRMLNQQRGLHLTQDNICITRGSQMAMYLTAQCLIQKGDYVIIENPGYKPAWQAFEHAGAQLLPVNIDQEGLCIEEVEAYLKSGKRIQAIYVTPHHQYPTTVTLSLTRRLQLIALANTYNFTIIEDDYDNEFHFGYRPILPLCSYAELKNYVYIGTLSKVVAPALRIGYLATNNCGLLEQVANLRKIIDMQSDNIMEQAVLELIKDGTLKRHIRKATVHYKAKRDCMATILHKYLSDKASFSIPDGGLAFWIVPKKRIDWVHVSQQLQNKGIQMIMPDKYSFQDTVNGLRIGYGSLSEQELEEGIIALAQFL